jgi:hypothetical protein
MNKRSCKPYPKLLFGPKIMKNKKNTIFDPMKVSLLSKQYGDSDSP